MPTIRATGNGAALSACADPDAIRSPSTANRSRSCREIGLGRSAFTATTDATLLAAELPSPELTGLASPPSLQSVVGQVLHTAAPEVGRFVCSDPSLTRLMQNNFEKLCQAMYRLDVSETKFDQVMQDKPLGEIPYAIADLVIEREMQKVRTRIMYKRGEI